MVWLVLVALGLVRVVGNSQCPTPDAVSAALAKLDALAAVGADQRIELDDTGEQLTVRWLDGAARQLHAWPLPRDGSCEELADLAALKVAVWAGRVDAGRVQALPVWPDPTARSPRLVARARPAKVAYAVAAAFLVGWEPGAAASYGGTADVTLGPRLSRFAARIAISAQSLQYHDITVGRVGWTRPALSLGARLRLSRTAFRFDLSADVVAALLVLGSDGFGPPTHSYDFDPGLDAGVRFGYRLGSTMPFVDVRLVGWLRQQTVLVSGLGTRYDLPRIDLWMSAGLAFGP
jgi:hypothetical protein